MSNPKLYITPKAIATIQAYARNCEYEISGWASVNKQGVIDRVFPLLSQKVTSAETEMDDDAIEQFIKSGQSKEANVWWHTHAKFGLFWSSTDEANISGLLSFFPFLVSIETNQAAEQFIGRVDYRVPIRFRQDVDVTIKYALPDINEDAIRKEIKQKVKFRAPVVHGKVEHISIPSEGSEMDGMPFQYRHGEGLVHVPGKGVHYRYGRIISTPALPPTNGKDEKKDDEKSDSTPDMFLEGSF